MSLAGASGTVQLPLTAERVAVLDEVYVLHVGLSTDESDLVRKRETDAAARLIGDQLGDDLLLVFTTASASQLHFIYPSFKTARPTLRRIIVERDLPRRTAVQQVSSIYWRFRGSDSIRTALEEAFDVEPVTREFFREYKRIFDGMNDGVTGFDAGSEEVEARRIFLGELPSRVESHLTEVRTMRLTGSSLLIRLQALRERYRLSVHQSVERVQAEPTVIRVVCSDGLTY